MSQNGRRGRRTNLSRYDINDLQRELTRKMRVIGKLQRKRDMLVGRLTKIEGLIEHSGGTRTGHGTRSHVGGRRRAVNEFTLRQVLQKVIGTKTMSVTEAAAAVQKAGYKTRSKPESFPVMVNQELLRSKYFTRVSRGRYTVKPFVDQSGTRRLKLAA